MADKQTSSVRLDRLQARYSPDRRIRTKSAAARARTVATWTRTGRGLDVEPDEHALFTALQTCAYRAARHVRGTSCTPASRRRWARRWQAIREHIVRKNLGLAYWTTRRFTSHAVDEDELLSEALCALARTVERFNPWAGCRFSTYAINAILRTLVRRDRRESRYRRLFPVQNETAFERPAQRPDSRPGLYVERLRRILAENVGDLSPVESLVLARRFPMDNRPCLTLQEVGDTVGLSKERVRQIQNTALRKLRGALADDPILR